MQSTKKKEERMKESNMTRLKYPTDFSRCVNAA